MQGTAPWTEILSVRLAAEDRNRRFLSKCLRATCFELLENPAAIRPETPNLWAVCLVLSHSFDDQVEHQGHWTGGAFHRGRDSHSYGDMIGSRFRDRRQFGRGIRRGPQTEEDRMIGRRFATAGLDQLFVCGNSIHLCVQLRRNQNAKEWVFGSAQMIPVLRLQTESHRMDPLVHLVVPIIPPVTGYGDGTQQFGFPNLAQAVFRRIRFPPERNIPDQPELEGGLRVALQEYLQGG